jgi:hypothetical protein
MLKPIRVRRTILCVRRAVRRTRALVFARSGGLARTFFSAVSRCTRRAIVGSWSAVVRRAFISAGLHRARGLAVVRLSGAFELSCAHRALAVFRAFMIHDAG